MLGSLHVIRFYNIVFKIKIVLCILSPPNCFISEQLVWLRVPFKVETFMNSRLEAQSAYCRV